MDYHLALDLEALRLLLSLKARQREELLRWLEQLRAQPNSRGQFTMQDATQRDVEVSTVGNLLVYHWPDHAVKTVQVVRIESIF